MRQLWLFKPTITKREMKDSKWNETLKTDLQHSESIPCCSLTDGHLNDL